MKMLKSSALAMLLFVASYVSWSQVSVGDVTPGKVAGISFTVKQAGKVKISGHAGTFREDWKLLVYYGWIIDSETRQVVWSQYSDDDLNRSRFEYGEVDFKNEITLSKGNYELYFAGGYHQPRNGWNPGFGDFMDYVFDKNHDRFRNRIQPSLGINVSGDVAPLNTPNLINSKVSGALVSILKPAHNANIRKGFSLSASSTLRIYAIGEGVRDDLYDYAWIEDLNKHERVWEMTRTNTDLAGGGEKNIVVNEKITLPAGNYLVHYITDDSHGFNDWNVLPPFDPQFIGVTVWAATEKDKKNVVPFTMPEEQKPVVQITHVHDNDFRSQGFTLKSVTDVRVRCLGEESSDDELADYGWIVHAQSREIVWDMHDQFRRHAGGASKNRVAESTVTLPPGDYIVYYNTDDSHSYGDWNSNPPHEQDYYGISIWVTKKSDINNVSIFDAGSYKNAKTLVEIVRVRDNEYLHETFTLENDTKLRIFALGEGVDGEMVDYGWIKNRDTGKVVWEMTYRNTENAGGHHKNRMYNDTILLPKGSYQIFYESDDSHSYRRWNTTPPREQEKYGITLSAEARNE